MALLMVFPVAAILPCPCVLVARATPRALWTSGGVWEGRGGVCGCFGMLRKVTASSLVLVCLGQLRGCLLCCKYVCLPSVLAPPPGGPGLQRAVEESRHRGSQLRGERHCWSYSEPGVTELLCVFSSQTLLACCLCKFSFRLTDLMTQYLFLVQFLEYSLMLKCDV